MMASSKELDLALRIHTDLKQAQAEMLRFEQTLSGVGKTATQAGKQLGGTASATDQNSARMRMAALIAQQHATASAQATRATGLFSKELLGLGRAGATAANEVQKVEAATKDVGGGITSLAASVKAATGALAAGFTLSQIVQAADAWTAFQNRLRLVTTTQQGLATATQDVYRIAQATSGAIGSTADVYQRFAQNAERLSITQREVASLTDTVSKAIAISGGAAASSEAALMQFGQALASGVLRGEEFNSVAEQAPGLLMAIADGLGVNIAQLRAMANEGQLTADVLVDGLSNAAASVNEQFETRVKTISQAAQELDNAFTRLVGVFSTGQGAGQGLTSALSGLATVLDGMADNAELLGAALDVALALAAGKAIMAITGLTVEGVKHLAIQKAQAAATLELARAEAAETAANLAATRQRYASFASHTAVTAATEANAAAQSRLAAAQLAAGAASNVLGRAFTGVVGTAGRLVGFLGGPVGIAISLALAATAFLDFGEDAETGMDKAAQATESASARVRNATRQMIQSLQLGDVGTASYDQLGKGLEQLNTQLKAAEAVRDRVQALDDNDVPVIPGMGLPTLDEANERVRSLAAAKQQLERERGGERFEGVREGEKYLDNLHKQHERLQNLTGAEEALAYLRKNQIDATSELGRRILAQAEANDRLEASNQANAEATREAETAARSMAQQFEQLNRAQEGYVTQLERQATVAGMTAAQVREYELAERGLTGALEARARAALATLDATERAKQAAADNKQVAALAATLQAAQGNEAARQALEFQQQFGELTARLRERGDSEGLAIIDGLINVERAKSRLSEVQSQIDTVLGAQQRQEQSVQTQQQAGLLTEMGARERILELHRETYDRLQEIRPVLEDLARQPGAVGEAARAALQALNAEAEHLNSTVSLLESTLRDGLTTGFTEALTGLANGTMTLRDAVAALGQSVLDAMTQMAAQNLGQMAANSLMGLFGGGQGDSSMTAGAAAVTSSAAALSAAGATLVTGAAAIEVAAASLAVANGASGAAGAKGGSKSGGWLSMALSLAGMFSGGGAGAGAGAGAGGYTGAFGFSEGGHVQGPGTTTSDSIPAMLSNMEFVTRAAVVAQPGALDFLHEFNARGMAALDNWAPRVRHSTGGLAGVPAPALPMPSMGSAQLAEPKAVASDVINKISLHVVDNPEQMASRIWGSRNTEHYLLEQIGRNPMAIRQLLGFRS